MNIIKILCGFIFTLMAILIGVYRSYAPHLNYRTKEKIKLGEIQVKDDLFTDEDIEYMKVQMQNTTLVSGQAGYNSIHPYAVSDPVNGRCPGKYHHLSPKGDKCVLSGRVDVAKHALLQGGSFTENLSYNNVLSRITILQNFVNVGKSYDDNQLPMFERIIESKEYIELIEPICGFKNPYLGNINPQVTLIQPGQELPQHFDVGFLNGIGAQNYPQWLIVAMKNSGLYKDIDTPQIQGVTYLHSWNNEESGKDLGGQLRAWDYGPSYGYKSFEAIQKRAILFDGGKIAHQSVTYKPDIKPLFFDKNIAYVTFYNHEQNQWDIYESQSGNFYNSVSGEDARLTIVWRQNCYRNKEESLEHKRRIKEGDHPQIEDVIQNLLENLVKEGRISSIPKEEIEKAEIIIDNYIEYAFDITKWFPYNLCVLLEFTVPRDWLNFFNFQSYC